MNKKGQRKKSTKALCLVMLACLLVVVVCDVVFAGPEDSSLPDSSQSEALPPETDTDELLKEEAGGEEDAEIEEGVMVPDDIQVETDETEDDASSPENGTYPQPEDARESGSYAARAAYQEGEVTVDGWKYYCRQNGTAELFYAKGASGNITIPTKIVGKGGAEYIVTRIYGYNTPPDSTYYGAFQGTGITGLAFETDSELTNIDKYAFRNCHGLVGKSISLPETVTNIGQSAFYLSNLDQTQRIGEIRHPHWAKVTGKLPSLEVATTPLTVPPQALEYEDMVDSTRNNTLLHKAAKWTNDKLTEAEIRNDFGRKPNYNGKVDFVFVMDHSGSMLEPATMTNASGSYTMPRYMFTNDIVYGASDILLNSGIPGYDNRVALVGFGDGRVAPWTSDFTNDITAVEDALFQHPVSIPADTNYEIALATARDLIRARTDTRRPVVMVFLSDGKPTEGQSSVPAGDLRDMKAKVYPISIYLNKGATGNLLKNLSHDGNTLYEVEDTDAFIKIITEVTDDIIKQEVDLQVTLEDVLSGSFQLKTGKPPDITVSSGKVEISGTTIKWVLDGSASGVVHTMTIQVKLKPDTELSAYGALPTSNSLKAGDGTISANTQPHLKRYLVYHQFVDEATGTKDSLPGEVLACVPKTDGGFRDQADVQPTSSAKTEVILLNGDRWEFVKWDKDNDTIPGDNVTFTGIWRLAKLEFDFTKTDETHTELPEAHFDLYRWTGAGQPPQDNYVTNNTTGSGKWTKTNAAPIESGADGKVKLVFTERGWFQLVEAAPPDGFSIPQAQWRFSVTDDFKLTGPATVMENSAATKTPNIEETTVNGITAWRLQNLREIEFSFLKISSEHYHDGEVSAQVLSGAEFELYLWKGTGAPAADALVTKEAVQQGQWELCDTQASGPDGKVAFVKPVDSGVPYQLVETRAPENYLIPQGQWRLTFDVDGTADILRIEGADGSNPPLLETAFDGKFAGKLTLTNIPDYKLPSAGGIGKLPFILGGCTMVLAGAFIFMTVQAKKRKQQVQHILQLQQGKQKRTYRK